MTITVFSSDFTCGIAGHTPSRVKRMSKRKLKRYIANKIAAINSSIVLPVPKTAVFSSFS